MRNELGHVACNLVEELLAAGVGWWGGEGSGERCMVCRKVIVEIWIEGFKGVCGIFILKVNT